MKKFMKFFTLVLVVATVATTMAFTLAACGGVKQVPKYEYSGELTVATEAKFAPYEYKEGDKYVGFDMELIEAAAKKIGFSGIKVTDVEFDAVIATVQADPYAVGIAAMTINPTRLEAVDFSDSYLSEAYQVLVYNAENTLFKDGMSKDDILKTIKDNKLTVNYAQGQTGQYYIEGNKAMNYPAVKCGKKVSQKDAPGVLSAITGNAVGVVDNGVAAKFCKSNPNIKFVNTVLTTEDYGVAVNKSNNQLKNDINKALKELKEDGTIDQLVAKYLQ